MKYRKTFLLLLLILPWLTIPLLGKDAFKKYAPAAVFMCTFTKAIDLFGENNKWWKFYKGIHPFDSMNFFNFGPYFITSLWMLKMAYGKIPLYFISNTLLHICFTYFGGIKFVSRYKIFSLDRLTKMQYLCVDFIRALCLYAFQFINDLAYKKNTFTNKELN